MFVLGLLIGVVVGLVVAFLWNAWKPEKFDKTTDDLKREWEEVNDKLKGD